MNENIKFWLTFIGTIIVAPTTQVILQKYFFHYDKRLENLKKTVKNLEKKMIKDQEKSGKEFAEFIVKIFEETDKMIREKACHNCRKEIRKILLNKSSEDK